MKAAIYCRLSEEDRDKTDPQADSESIQNQKNMLITHALEQGWDIFDIYSDDDYRGSDRSRPEFNRLLHDAEARKFQIVLCKSQSRFTRELELVEKYIHGLFLEWGIRFVGKVDYADTSVKGNKKSRQINGLVNEWYLEDLSESVSAALDTKRNRGEYIGSFPLYGYKKSAAEKGKLEIDDGAAPTVRRIFRMYHEGYGFTAIAKRLNDENVPNPTAYKASLGMKCAQKMRASLGTNWSVNTVRSILKNRMYIGDMVQGRYERISYKSKKLRSIPKQDWMVSAGTHEPIVDAETWNAAQLRLTQRTKAAKNGTVHLFAGKVFCMECGAALHSNFARGIKYLRCPAGEVAKARCCGSAIQLRVMEQHVLDGINRLVQAYFDEQELEDRVVLHENSEADKMALEKEKSRREKAQADLKKAALSLYMDKTKGILSDKDYEMLSTELSAERESLERGLRALDEQMAVLDLKLKARQTKADILAKYKRFSELNRALVCDFIDRIEVGGRDRENRAVRLKIVWKI